MTILEAVLLGIIQGITEFLPVSSTAHLTIAGKVLGFVDPAHPQVWTEFIAVMQLGTLVAVLAYFRKDLASMVAALYRDCRPSALRTGAFRISAESKLAFFIVIGTIPVMVVGFFFKNLIEGTLTKTTSVLIGSLIGLAALLWCAEVVSRHRRGLDSMTWRDALLIGCAQALALIPGSSRSGTTLTGGLFLGFAREAAARFSFLLSIPAVLASGLFEMLRIDPSVFSLGALNLVVATVVSGLSGYAAIAWLLRYLMRRTTMVFVWYRIGLGLLLVVALLKGWIDP